MKKPFEISSSEREYFTVESRAGGKYWVPYNRLLHVWLDTTGGVIYVETESVTIVIEGNDLKDSAESIVSRKLISLKEIGSGLSKEPGVKLITIEEKKKK